MPGRSGGRIGVLLRRWRAEWRSLARDRRSAVVQVVKTALATGLAWDLALVVTDSRAPIFAPLSALLVVQITVRRSVRGALERVIAVVAGLLVALVVAQVAGVSGATIALVVGVSLLLGRAIQLGPAGAVQVPVSALLVLVVGGTQPGAAQARVLDTVLGAAVGVLVNALVAPPVGVRPAQVHVSGLAVRLAALLSLLSEGVGNEFDRNQARVWLLVSRTLPAALASARETVDNAEDSLRWNPRGRGAQGRTGRLRSAVTALEHVVLQTRGITRTVHDLPGTGTFRLDRDMVLALGRAAAAVGAFAEVVRADAVRGSAPVTDLSAAVTRARGAVEQAVHSAGPEQAGDSWLALGSLLADLRRLLREVDPDGPHGDAIAAATAP